MQRTFCLGNGESETLKVAPKCKVLSVSTFSRGGSVEKVGSVINLFFEGNYSPITVRCSAPGGLCLGRREDDALTPPAACRTWR